MLGSGTSKRPSRGWRIGSIIATGAPPGLLFHACCEALLTRLGTAPLQDALPGRGTLQRTSSCELLFGRLPLRPSCCQVHRPSPPILGRTKAVRAGGERIQAGEATVGITVGTRAEFRAVICRLREGAGLGFLAFLPVISRHRTGVERLGRRRKVSPVGYVDLAEHRAPKREFTGC